MLRILAFSVQQKQIMLLGSLHLIISLKNSTIIAEHMVDVHFLVLLSSDGCKAYKRMQPWKFNNQLRDAQGQVRICKDFLATLIDTGRDRSVQKKLILVFREAQVT